MYFSLLNKSECYEHLFPVCRITIIFFLNKCIELFISFSTFLHDLPEVEIALLCIRKSCTYAAFLYLQIFVKFSNGYAKTGHYLNVVQLLWLLVKIITGQYSLVCMLVVFIVLVWFYLALFLLIICCHPELLVLPFCICCNEFPPVVKLFNQKSLTFMVPKTNTSAGLVALLCPLLLCQ